MTAGRGRPEWLALGFVASFMALAVLVATGATQSLDVRAIHQLRPGDVWGPTQVRFSPWMSWLEPERMYLLLALTSLATSVRRRAWWPAVFGGVLAVASVALTLLGKFAFHRPDPHGYVTATGGSYPSGHIIAVLVCLGGCLLVVRPKVRWWQWAPVVIAAALMTVGLLVSAAHWPTDVLGGVFLSLAVVLGSSGLPLRWMACGTSRGRRAATDP